MKFVVSLEPGEDTWFSWAAESMWAEDLGGGRYRVRNVPIAAYELSGEDVVTAKLENDRLKVLGVVARGGHSTYRVNLSAGMTTAADDFKKHWESLRALGCSYEGFEDRILAIDVPAHADIHDVYRHLEEGERAGTWSFEEAHCGHPI